MCHVAPSVEKSIYFMLNLIFLISYFFAGKDAFEGNGFEDFIEAVSAKKWKKAADKLEKTRWCNDNKDRCRDDKGIISKGCDSSAVAALIAQVTNNV